MMNRRFRLVDSMRKFAIMERSTVANRSNLGLIEDYYQPLAGAIRPRSTVPGGCSLKDTSLGR